MTSPLENLAAAGHIHAEPPDRLEYAGLIASGQARLEDAEEADLSPESRFDLGYNAAHALCLAALRRAGFRPASRYIVFQALPHTLGLGPDVWRVLALCHQRRNQAEYEGYMDVEEQLVRDLIKAGRAVERALKALPQP